jgi:ribosomal protein S18 acetylase RimI-like enzyme
MEFRSMDGVRMAELHAAFVDAFSEYDVPMTLSQDALLQMMTIRDYHPCVSVGCFEAGQLVGFVLVGVRGADGARRAYDVATGVVRSHQNQHIGSRLVAAVIEGLRAQGIASFVLEVLEQNEAARRLYERQGFVIERRFACYQFAYTASRAMPAGWELLDSLPPDSAEVTYNGYLPSWQQSLQSYRNAASDYAVVGLREAHLLSAYGIVQRQNGSVMQIGILPDWRGRIRITQVVDALAAQTGADALRFVNVEDGSWVAHQLASNGWTVFVYQHEMMRQI